MSSTSMAATKLTSFARSITVEPALLLYMVGSYMEYGVYQDMLYNKVCLQHYNYDHNLCNNLTGDALEYVQTQGSYWLQYNNIALLVPSIVVACFLGSWGDLHGRKLPMILSAFTTLLGYLVFIIISVYEDSPVELTLVANFVTGLGGGYLMLSASVMSYVADITTSQNRTTRISILESMTFIGDTAGMLISGYLLKSTSYAYTFLFCLVCNVLVILYLVVRISNKIPEPKVDLLMPVVEPGSGSVDALVVDAGVGGTKIDSIVESTVTCKCVYAYQGIVACFKKREGRKRLYLLLIMASCIFVFFASNAESDLTYLYVKDQPLSWDYMRYSEYSSLKSGLGGIMLLIALPLMRRYLNLNDTTLSIIGLTSRICGLLLLSFSTTTTMMFLVPFLAIFAIYPIPCFRAMMSKLVEPTEQGKMFSALATVENICDVLASILFNNLYPATRSILHGFCFLVAVGLLIFPFSFISWIHFDKKPVVENYEHVEEPQGQQGRANALSSRAQDRWRFLRSRIHHLVVNSGHF